MRRMLLPLLLAGNVALALWLAWLWVTPAGQVKGVQWQQPAPLPPALDGDTPLPETGVDTGRYVATLERPLFSPSRRMPPPPQAASAPPVIDSPPDIRVLGLYGSSADGAVGGMVARIDGQVKRVKVGDAVGRWTLKALRPGEAVLSMGDSEQVYPLRRAAADEPPASSIADNAGPAGAPSAPRAPAVDPMRQRQIEEARANVRRINALRARSGLPPVPEP